ncbi:MAG TPA: hypothetical protein VFF60_08115, partial [Candidatus Binatus sp.]|nr:hypothetical protein [Candidatus Binatus sp.]
HACNAFRVPLYIPLVFPGDGSTGVSRRIGTLVFQGSYDKLSPPIEDLTDQAGKTVVAVPLGPPPSRLPSPLATPPGVQGAPYGAITIPTLSPLTTYHVQIIVEGPCIGSPISDSFTTGPS